MGARDKDLFFDRFKFNGTITRPPGLHYQAFSKMPGGTWSHGYQVLAFISKDVYTRIKVT